MVQTVANGCEQNLNEVDDIVTYNDLSWFMGVWSLRVFLNILNMYFESFVVNDVIFLEKKIIGGLTNY